MPDKLAEQLILDEEFVEQIFGENYESNLVKFVESLPLVRLIDLNNDGRNELVIWGTHEMQGNHQRSIWVYRQIGSKFEQVLNTTSTEGMDDCEICFEGRFFRSLNTFSNGYRDTEGETGCCSGAVVVYRFNGRRYHPKECSEWGKRVIGTRRNGTQITNFSSQRTRCSQ